MRVSQYRSTLLPIFLCVSIVTAIHINAAGRENDILANYDFVVVGGGTSGLVVANRLTENPKTTILVIEAGDFDQGEDTLYVPYIIGYNGGATGTKYDWKLNYSPQPGLNNRTIPLVQGKVVGGGSSMNRMIFDRGSVHDFERWAKLGDNWGWNEIFPYYKKSEIFTPPPASFATEWGITWNPLYHGSAGNVQSSFPPFIWPSTKFFFEAMKWLKIRIPKDAAGGKPIGAFWNPHSLDPRTKRRSNARTAYYDSANSRPNLHLLTGHYVTKLLTRKSASGIVITGVEYATDSNSTRKTVNANKEVILAAGATHTPQILQLSGIGEKSLLQKLGIKTVIDLPGVGNNFQDHSRLTMIYNLTQHLGVSNMTLNATFNAEMRALYDTKKIGPYTTPGSNSLSFLPLPIFSNETFNIQAAAFIQPPSQYLAPNLPSSILRGYETQHKILVAGLNNTQSGLMEFIYNDGTFTISLQHPFSRGSVTIQSLSPFTPPLINPRYLSNPLDLTFLVESVKFARKIISTPPFAPLNPIETLPGLNVQTDAEIKGFIRNTLSTITHPAGTTSMMKRSLGGVVDGKLKVYGVQNLRVVDASVMPMLPGTHLSSTVYAIAEMVSDFIKEAHGI